MKEIIKKDSGSTHWEGCWKEHDRCFLLETIHALEKELGETRTVKVVRGEASVGEKVVCVTERWVEALEKRLEASAKMDEALCMRFDEDGRCYVCGFNVGGCAKTCEAQNALDAYRLAGGEK